MASGRTASRVRRRGDGLPLYLAAGGGISAIFVVPLLWEVFRSFQPSLAISSPPSSRTFGQLTTANYHALLAGQDDIVRNIANSLLVAVLTALLTAAAATLAGYGFGRFRFRGSGIAFGLVLLAFMIPFQAVLTPLFLEMHFLHLLNSLIGLALFYTAFNLPFGVYVMRNSFLAVPREIVDAARVDGASVTDHAGVGAPPPRPAGHRDDHAVCVPVLLDGVPRGAHSDDERRSLHPASRSK